MQQGEKLYVEAVPGMAKIFENNEWHKEGACYDKPDSMFIFAGNPPIKVKKAKAICAECAVIETCLEEEMKRPQTQSLGVRGGLSESERKKLEKTRKRAKADKAKSAQKARRIQEAAEKIRQERDDS
ncbi:MAG: WhiB family transcriptional regulator [Candidatus Spechtbacterales bacterium]|nr:WhiB family transcriptional regulator [Candidatus Spechtbacterales bacterium]